jgi:transposase-like protein
MTQAPDAAQAAPEPTQTAPQADPGERAWAALERAVGRAGMTLAEVAAELGIRRQALTGWRDKTLRLGKLWVPSERVLDLERILKPHLSKERMRPDLYRRARKRA